MNDQDFYAETARLLNTSHEGKPFPYRRRTRWNNRIAGQGRFPGRGIVRVFGEKTILVALRSPTVNRTFDSKAAALTFLATLGDQLNAGWPAADF